MPRRPLALGPMPPPRLSDARATSLVVVAERPVNPADPHRIIFNVTSVEMSLMEPRRSNTPLRP
jgi:hypothetical protein